MSKAAWIVGIQMLKIAFSKIQVNLNARKESYTFCADQLERMQLVTADTRNRTFYACMEFRALHYGFPIFSLAPSSLLLPGKKVEANGLILSYCLLWGEMMASAKECV